MYVVLDINIDENSHVLFIDNDEYREGQENISYNLRFNNYGRFVNL